MDVMPDAHATKALTLGRCEVMSTARLLLGTIIMSASIVSPAWAGSYGSCSFETIPDIILHYPAARTEQPTMRVDYSSPVEMVVGSGSGRFESAVIDGYTFQFSPQNSTVDVIFGGATLISERGECLFTATPVRDPVFEFISANEPDTTQDERQSAPSDDKGDWRISVDQSGFDDTSTVVVRTSSDAPLRNQYGQSKDADLILRCKENTTSVYLVMGGYFLSDIQGYGEIDFRIDAQSPFSHEFDVSTDNEALGLWSGRRAIPFIKSLFGGERLLVRLTPYNESPLETSFEITGIEPAVSDLREACNW